MPHEKSCYGRKGQLIVMTKWAIDSHGKKRYICCLWVLNGAIESHGKGGTLIVMGNGAHVISWEKGQLIFIGHIGCHGIWENMLLY